MGMIRVYSAQHPTEAHYVKGLLELAGIECTVRGEALFGARGELPITLETAPSVWIYDDAQLGEAQAIVQEYENLATVDTASGTMWTCPACLEESEEQFTACWNCLRSRTG